MPTRVQILKMNQIIKKKQLQFGHYETIQLIQQSNFVFVAVSVELN